jgi:arsenate reductase
MKGVLFMCVANSARSQMAEGWAHKLAPPGVEIYSAGSFPWKVHPAAIEVMQERGIDITGQRSKAVAEISPDRIDTVVTLCAEEVCPVWLGHAARLHWPLPDPAMTWDEDERMDAFRRTRDELERRIAELFAPTK